MMQISVRGARALRSLAVNLEGSGFIVGRNAAGKSTLATCLGALLTGDPKLGMTVDARRLTFVREGQEIALLRIEDSEGWSEITWPGAQLLTNGNPPRASRVATGLDKLARMKPADRASLMVEVLKANPSKTDWIAACARAGGISDDRCEKVWEKIQAEGWDAASVYASRKATAAKGVWQHVTGLPRWGSNIGEGWEKPGFSKYDLMAPLADYQGLVDMAKHARDAAMKQGAVNAAERARLEELAHQEVPNLSLDKAAADKAQAAYEKREQEIGRIAIAKPAASCPHCGGVVEIWPENDPPIVRQPAKQVQIDPATMRKWRDELAALENAVRNARDLVANRKVVAQDIEAARASLASLPSLDHEELDRAELDLAKAEEILGAAAATQNARKAHREVMAYLRLSELASADGLRRWRLGELLDVFNGIVERYWGAAGWPAVKLDDALNVSMGGRPYAALSESEQWRTDTALAMAMAEVDKSTLVVLDGADKLDTAGRNGLVAAMQECSLPVLVLMTGTPKLAGQLAGIMPTWWLEAGEAKRIEGEAA